LSQQQQHAGIRSYFTNTIVGKCNVDIAHIAAIDAAARQAQSKDFAHRSLRSTLMLVKKLARKKDRPRHYSASIVSSADAILATHWFDDAIAHRVRFELCVLSAREAIHVSEKRNDKSNK
jgi:hypothetical protein